MPLVLFPFLQTLDWIAIVLHFTSSEKSVLFLWEGERVIYLFVCLFLVLPLYVFHDIIKVFLVWFCVSRLFFFLFFFKELGMMLGKVKWLDQTSSTSQGFSGITEKEEGEGPGVPQNTRVFVLLFDWLRAQVEGWKGKLWAEKVGFIRALKWLNPYAITKLPVVTLITSYPLKSA